MELADNNLSADAPAQELPRGFWAGLRRIPEGLRDGSLIGLITGGITGIGVLALDAAFSGLGISEFLHIDNGAFFTAKMAGLHAVAHGGLDAYTEFREGVRGIPDEKDMYHQYVESLEHKVKALEQSISPPAVAVQTALTLSEQNPATSPVIQAILAQRNNAPSARNWQERLAAQQTLQDMQDRTV